MTTREKIKLITKNLEETLTEEELRALIESGTPLKHYIGFEISGKVHLGTGLACLLKIKDLQDAGVTTTILLADWHTWLNKKLDGTLETARKMARSYFEEGLKAGALCVGADPGRINFVLGSELYNRLGTNYWATAIKVSKATTQARMLRSTTIMGRQIGDTSDAAMLIYPAMQSADIFRMNIDIAHAGTDQRNVHVLARDVAPEIDEKKPIVIHHHLILGLGKIDVPHSATYTNTTSTDLRMELIAALKMSKSKPDSAIFIHDSPEEIRRKVMGAYCPEKVVELNPILDWVKWLIFYNPTEITIEREEGFGGNITYNSYQDLEKDFTEGNLHPQDLKKAVGEWLVAKLEPARKYFEDPKRKTALDEIEKLTTRQN